MDIAVTVPRSFRHPRAPGKQGLAAWIAEGDPAGAPWSGTFWTFFVGGAKPPVEPGDRIYVVCQGRLRGYAPLVCLERFGPQRWGLIRGGGAVAVTLPEAIEGFRGWRRRWWPREAEIPFSDWQLP